MTSLEHGDVVLVELVFTNQRQRKLRPGLVLSTAEYHSQRDELVLAAITSNLASPRPGDTVLADWEAAGLRLPSVATAILQTLRKELVVQSLGRLSTADLAEVESNLAEALGLAS